MLFGNGLGFWNTIPMRLLSSVISKFLECIFVPLYRISPLTRNIGTRSFILLRHLINVLLPHPEGPIIAVTDFSGISKFTFFNAGFSPYHALKSFTLKAIIFHHLIFFEYLCLIQTAIAFMRNVIIKSTIIPAAASAKKPFCGLDTQLNI